MPVAECCVGCTMSVGLQVLTGLLLTLLVLEKPVAIAEVKAGARRDRASFSIAVRGKCNVLFFP